MWGGNRGREGFEQKAREMSIILGGGEGGGSRKAVQVSKRSCSHTPAGSLTGGRAAHSPESRGTQHITAGEEDGVAF